MNTQGNTTGAAPVAGKPEARPRPGGSLQEWLLHQVVVHSMRIDRCQAQESALKAQEVARAERSWDDDRRCEAEELGARIGRDPSLVVARLRRTLQGCRWMLDRWARLGAILDRGGAWTGRQRTLALHLLGVPIDLRDPAIDLGAGEGIAPREVVRREMAALERLCAGSLAELDRMERDAARRHLQATPSKAMQQLRREEARCRKAMQEAEAELRRQAPAAKSLPTPEPKPSPAIAAAPPPSPAPAPLSGPQASATPPPSPLVPRSPARLALASALDRDPGPLNRRKRRALESRAGKGR